MNRYCYDELKIGHEDSFNVEVTEEMLDSFIKLTGDDNPLHSSKDYAVARGCDGRVCHGMLTASFLSTLAGIYLPGEKSLIHSVKVNFMRPVTVGETLTIKGTIKAKDDKFHILTLKTDIYDKNDAKVLRGVMTIGVRDE